MSNEVNFHIELRGKGGGKKVVLNHDVGQGGDEILVSVGQEAVVVDPWDLANMCRRALELLTNDSYEQQVRTTGPAVSHGVTRPADRVAPVQRMPPPPMQRPAPPPPPPRPVNDPDDK